MTDGSSALVPSPGDVRASDAEREQTVDQLRMAAGEGRLTLEELADRIEVAYSATSRGELAVITRDLPAETSSVAPPAAPAAPALPAVAGQRSVFGDLTRKGSWLVPARSGWSSVFGDITLDVRGAQIPREVDIVFEVHTVFGDIDLLVPEGVAVELRVKTIFGDITQGDQQPAAPGAPRIIVTGSSTFGDITVRTKRLREKLANWIATETERGRRA